MQHFRLYAREILRKFNSEVIMVHADQLSMNFEYTVRWNCRNEKKIIDLYLMPVF